VKKYFVSFVLAAVMALCLASAHPAAAQDCGWIFDEMNETIENQANDLDMLRDLSDMMNAPDYDPGGDDSWVEPFYYQISDDYQFETDYLATLGSWWKQAACV
jgi:hypothetical protein